VLLDNLLDCAIVFLGPALVVLQVLSVLNAGLINWAAKGTYVNLWTQVWIGETQTTCYSLLVFVGCIKLFDYLSVFPNLYRLIVMIEMMAKQLINFTIVLALFLVTFTVSEYIAFGYRDENSYTIRRGFISRVFGLFSGDPVVFGHTDSGRMLGTFYVMVFLISVSMVLMNLIVAVLTSAYDEARNQSSDVLARRHYQKMHQMGYTKIRNIAFRLGKETVLQVSQTEADQRLTALDKFDIELANRVSALWNEIQRVIDTRRAALFLARKAAASSKPITELSIPVSPEEASRIRTMSQGKFQIVQEILKAKEQNAAASKATFNNG